MAPAPISIVGDSFGCGEWAIDYNTKSGLINSHTGTSHYLKKANYRVNNYSEGGASLLDILDQITNNNISNETIIVFATDAFRHCHKYQPLLRKLFLQKDYSISKLHFIFFQDWLKQLTKISKDNTCEVILVGGHSNLYEFDVPSNMTICTNSWLSDILAKPIGNLSGIDTTAIENLMQLKPITKDVQKQELLDILSQRASRLHATANSRNKFADHIHPNRECHKLLTDKIIKLLG